MRLPDIPSDLTRVIDPNGGFICLWSYWRPDPDAPDPEEHGQKLMMSTFLPCQPEELCLCGSGKLYQDCCRPKLYMHPICRNPGIETAYSLIKLRTGRFHKVNPEAVREVFNNDERLICTEDAPASGFWTYWGVPALGTEYGIICFGDIALKGDTLEFSAMSDIRWETLMSVVRGAVGEDAEPTIHRQPAPKMRKPRKRRGRS